MFDDAPETRIIVKPYYNRQLISSERDKKFFNETYSMNKKTVNSIYLLAAITTADNNNNNNNRIE